MVDDIKLGDPESSPLTKDELCDLRYKFVEDELGGLFDWDLLRDAVLECYYPEYGFKVKGVVSKASRLHTRFPTRKPFEFTLYSCAGCIGKTYDLIPKDTPYDPPDWDPYNEPDWLSLNKIWFDVFERISEAHGMHGTTNEGDPTDVMLFATRMTKPRRR